MLQVGPIDRKKMCCKKLLEIESFKSFEDATAIMGVFAFEQVILIYLMTKSSVTKSNKTSLQKFTESFFLNLGNNVRCFYSIN